MMQATSILQFKSEKLKRPNGSLCIKWEKPKQIID